VNRRRAFSLVEMIGVLAIISIVAAILTPNLARRISRLNGEREDEALAVLGEALTRHVRTYQSIPGANSWITNVATLSGLGVSDVRYVRPTDTATARVYLIHPAFYPTNPASADPLYTQNTAGAASLTNARIVIVSCHKSGLTLPVSSGKASSAAVFDAIWDWHFDPATRSPPSGWNATWTANGEYLHVQRLNLAPLFHRVTFSNTGFPTATPNVQIGASTLTLNATSAVETFFLQGTALRLYRDTGVGGGLEITQGIESPANFLYENDRWRVP
jgi:prepilin-type N-terminal cleavage/methylation domain-containing protein